MKAPVHGDNFPAMAIVKKTACQYCCDRHLHTQRVKWILHFMAKSMFEAKKTPFNNRKNLLKKMLVIR